MFLKQYFNYFKTFVKRLAVSYGIVFSVLNWLGF